MYYQVVRKYRSFRYRSSYNSYDPITRIITKILSGCPSPFTGREERKDFLSFCLSVARGSASLAEWISNRPAGVAPSPSLAGGRFCGRERPNSALTGLCHAGIAPRLLSAMLLKVCVCRALV